MGGRRCVDLRSCGRLMQIPSCQEPEEFGRWAIGICASIADCLDIEKLKKSNRYEATQRRDVRPSWLSKSRIFGVQNFRISEFGTHQQRYRAVSRLSIGLLGKCFADTAQNGDVRGNPAAWPTLISRPSSLTRARLGLAFSFRCSFFSSLPRVFRPRIPRARRKLGARLRSRQPGFGSTPYRSLPRWL